MSTVILQIGQCGNQVGQELWELLEQDQANHKGYVKVCHIPNPVFSLPYQQFSYVLFSIIPLIRLKLHVLVQK